MKTYTITLDINVNVQVNEDENKPYTQDELREQALSELHQMMVDSPEIINDRTLIKSIKE